MTAQPHVRVNMIGRFLDSTNAGVEIFSMSLAFAIGVRGSGALTGVPTQAQLNALSTDANFPQLFADWFKAPNMGISEQVILDEVKFASIGADGKYVGDAALVVIDTKGGVGGNPGLPSECALAMSLATGVRGAKGRGRFYMPTQAISISTDWRAQGTPGPASMVPLTVTMLNDLGAGLDRIWGLTEPQEAVLVVASKVAGNLEVTGIRCGDVVDVIRRRRNALKEVYVSQAL